MNTLGFWLQVLGLGFTFVGLIISWVQWSTRGKKWATWFWTLLRRRRPQVVTLSAAAELSVAVSMTASGTVIRTGTPVEERLEAIEKEQGRSEAQVANTIREFMGHIDKVQDAQVAARQEVDRKIELVQKVTNKLVAKGQLSGLWFTVIGVFLSLLGLVLERARPNWVFIF